MTALLKVPKPSQRAVDAFRETIAECAPHTEALRVAYFIDVAPLIAENERLTKERDVAFEQSAAHEAKWRSICEYHGECACSYDKSTDVCDVHSPKLIEARSEIERLTKELGETRLAYEDADEKAQHYQAEACLAHQNEKAAKAENDRLTKERVAYDESISTLAFFRYLWKRRAETAERQNATLVEALRPFSTLNTGRLMTDGLKYEFRIDVAHIRRARAALAQLDAPQPNKHSYCPDCGYALDSTKHAELCGYVVRQFDVPTQHASDCAVHNEPAFPNGHCDCGEPDARAGSYQARVHEWVVACFGEEIGSDKIERTHRFLEEALETVQAAGCTRSEAHQLVDYVFDRPVGELWQEVGGVMNTLAAFCTAHGLDMDECGERELARVWLKIEAIRAKQAAKPKHSPLPQPTERPVTSDEVEDAINLYDVVVIDGSQELAMRAALEAFVKNRSGSWR